MMPRAIRSSLNKGGEQDLVTSRSRDLDPDKQLDRAAEEEEKAVTNIIINTTATAVPSPPSPVKNITHRKGRRIRDRPYMTSALRGVGGLTKKLMKVRLSTDKLCKRNSANGV